MDEPATPTEPRLQALRDADRAVEELLHRIQTCYGHFAHHPGSDVASFRPAYGSLIDVVKSLSALERHATAIQSGGEQVDLKVPHAVFQAADAMPPRNLYDAATDIVAERERQKAASAKALSEVQEMLRDLIRPVDIPADAGHV